MKTLFYTLIASAILSACSCTKVKKETYTISGTLYQDYQMQPVANEVLNLHLVTESNEGAPHTGEIVSTTSTDAKGSFKLEYQEIPSGYFLSIINVNRKEIYRKVPNNKNITKNIFNNNFISFNINVIGLNKLNPSDTFILSYGNFEILNYQSYKIVTLADRPQYPDSVETIVLQKGQYDIQIVSDIKFKSGPSYPRTEPIPNSYTGFAWGIGKEDYLKSYHSGQTNFGQKFPDYYHRIQVPISPYPAVNEVTINIE